MSVDSYTKEVPVEVSEMISKEALQVIQTAKADAAAQYLVEFDGKFEPLTPKEEKWAIMKCDLCLIPVLFFTATMGAVDKVSLGTAAIFGFRTDTNLVGQQYSWLSSIIFIGSLVGMWPMSYLVQRFRLGKVLAICSMLWSTFCLLLCACHSFPGLAALRFLMGFVESAIVPGCSLMISVFYLKTESPHRTAIVFVFASSVINGALSSLASVFGNQIPTWKYIFILVGSVSFVWSCFVLWFLPDSPLNARFLNDREKYFMVRRVAANSTGVENKEWKWYQVKEAFLDIRVYIVMLFNFGINIPNGGLSTFSSIIIKNLGFTSVESSLMGMPTGVIASLSTVFFTWWGSRWVNRRCFVSILSLIVPLVGAVVVYAVDRSNVAGQLVGLYMMYFYFASYVVIISLVQANTAGNTKKSVTYSFNYLGYCGGAVTGSQTFRANQAPKYTGGFISMIVAYCVCILLCVVYWLICVYLNKKKELADDNEATTALGLEGLEDEQLLDLTDMEQKHFRYIT
ncbi:unnamed protein product [Kuraishia capsulata CBS 1993]|uniref:Major facilitator superfamily (MFS) profile domain-containing protein n=1 Tax=Kuraishia capsulata CBS 1993 TaxID=1382522 RepID=W6MVJ7_9ASCO|nr:uncharacterized protein KUCA_T00002316001 [Kuraishia capsulata CBS 1993]CDK26345.1 unnamed protein product [Kuraishia capsulata CBS 1993]